MQGWLDDVATEIPKSFRFNNCNNKNKFGPVPVSSCDASGITRERFSVLCF